MDYDISDIKGGKNSSASGCGVSQEIDAAGIFLDTLKAFDEADRLENINANEEFITEEEESFLPSLENIMVFSSYIREKMDFLLTFAKIPAEPAIELDMDARTGKILVRGERNDLRKISRVINGDAEVRDGLVTLLSIAEQTYQLLESLDSDTETDFSDSGRVIYMYGDGYLSLYKD